MAIRRSQSYRYRTARTRSRALHRIFDGIRHPTAHLTKKFIGNVGELHTRHAPLFIRPFETAPTFGTSLFIQIESELHFRFRSHAFYRAETKTVFRQIKNHPSIAWLYFNIEEVLKTLPRRLPAFKVISHALSKPKSSVANLSSQ
jgi:hypothetical protein